MQCSAACLCTACLRGDGGGLPELQRVVDDLGAGQAAERRVRHGLHPGVHVLGAQLVGGQRGGPAQSGHARVNHALVQAPAHQGVVQLVERGEQRLGHRVGSVQHLCDHGIGGEHGPRVGQLGRHRVGVGQRQRLVHRAAQRVHRSLAARHRIELDGRPVSNLLDVLVVLRGGCTEGLDVGVVQLLDGAQAIQHVLPGGAQGVVHGGEQVVHR
mmetsp:Transcript_23881/g.60822  ORF Transcript_23881/g.60822 Transcript_23881/m.60822 type:complete len:213 (+) Transcript_23881:852-1490(+)